MVADALISWIVDNIHWYKLRTIRQNVEVSFNASVHIKDFRKRFASSSPSFNLKHWYIQFSSTLCCKQIHFISRFIFFMYNRNFYSDLKHFLEDHSIPDFYFPLWWRRVQNNNSCSIRLSINI